jgi:hypothetical protein
MWHIRQCVEELRGNTTHRDAIRNRERAFEVKVLTHKHAARHTAGRQDIIDGAHAFNNERPLLLPDFPALERAYKLDTWVCITRYDLARGLGCMGMRGQTRCVPDA